MTPSLPTLDVIDTPLAITTYDGLTSHLNQCAAEGHGCAVDFTNTHIVTMRRHDPDFRNSTSSMDLFIPDGMPLIWCLNAQGAGLKDRVYGPTFTRKFLQGSDSKWRHFFLGGSDACLQKLRGALAVENNRLTIAGMQNGYFTPTQEPGIAETILRAQPHFLWVGLGTPKQQEWIAQWKSTFPHCIILAVGFAFDVIAGTKPDAPLWMQRLGLTWLFRIASEPRRLAGRYLKYNFLFLRYLITK